MLIPGFSHFTVRLFGDRPSRVKFSGDSGLVWKTTVSASDMVLRVSKTQTDRTATLKLVADGKESRRKVVTVEPIWCFTAKSRFTCWWDSYHLE